MATVSSPVELQIKWLDKSGGNLALIISGVAWQ